jgi:small subunit ribosomal protein S9
MATSIIQTVGRRKNAIAKVSIRPGSGKFMVNGKEIAKYFHREINLLKATQPLTVTSTEKVYDVFVKAFGGGETGQADAVKLGLARALLKSNEKFKPSLRQFGLLTRDPRMVERKKYGHPKARKRFQFSKR